MRKAALVLIICAMALGSGGCLRLLGQFYVGLVKPKDYRDIPKEYDLTATKLVVVPYVPSDIQFEYPELAIEISNNIVYGVAANLKDKVKEIEYPIRVVQWQESNLDWPNLSLEEIGKVFGADTVLYVELERYSVLEENSANLLRGRARGRIEVAKVGAPHNPVYSGVAEVVFPKDYPVNNLTVSERVMRQNTNKLFGDEVANKFHDRRVEVEPGQP